MPWGSGGSSLNKPFTYRADIDGLRAVAVLAVLLYHVGYTALPGGYVGVDIFFVISGFLITRLIREEVTSTGSFRFGDFYLRRVRRLFPALITTVALTFFAGALVLAPEHLESLGGAALSSIVPMSNIYFWGEAGYWDASKLTKPLLHTWSLAVEEQFYFVSPLLIVVAVRLGFASALIALLSLASLIAAQYYLAEDASAVFFLTPFRVVEFGIGALLAWFSWPRQLPNWSTHIASIAGLLLIAYAMLFYTEQTTFPGVAALVPCLGAALLIAAGPRSAVGRILATPPMVAIGLLSYSLYLVHWPLIVLVRYHLMRDFTEISVS